MRWRDSQTACACRAEALKMVTFPAVRWAGAATAALALLQLWSAARGRARGGAGGLEQVAWSWTVPVQVGFLVTGALACAAGTTCLRTTLLVQPVRARVAGARTGVVGLGALAAAGLLLAPVAVLLPGRGTAGATGRVLLWLVAAALIGSGAAGLLRRASTAVTGALLLVVVPQALSGYLGAAGRLLPGVAAPELLGGARGPGSRTAALLTVLAWVCVCQLAGAWRTIRSDT